MCVLKYTRSDINDILVLRMRCRTFEMHNKQTSNIKPREREKKIARTHTHAQNGKWNVPHFLAFFIAWPMRDQISKIRWWSAKKARCNDSIYIDTTLLLRHTAHAPTQTNA